MTRLTIRRGGTKRVRATFFADQGAGIARDLSGLALMVIDQSPNIVPPALAILPPATGGQIEVLWTDEQTAPLKAGAGRVWLTLILFSVSSSSTNCMWGLPKQLKRQVSIKSRS